MERNPACTVYIGNLDEKVSEKILYEVLMQVGHLVDLHIPRDRETNHRKGYAFAEYETEEIADYAVRLFSGLVRLHNRTLKFAISGQDKPSQNQAIPVLPKPNYLPLPKPHPVNARDTEMSKGSSLSIVNCMVTAGSHFSYPAHPRASANGLVSKELGKNNFGYGRRLFGTMLGNVNCPGDRHLIDHPSC